jgi:hypothetical protein
MSTEKIEELARDIAREQYTDDPDDPHWWEDEDDDDDPDRVVYVDPNGVEVTQRELDALDQLAAGYCARNNINIFN